jgi:hypothetical protein
MRRDFGLGQPPDELIERMRIGARSLAQAG